jgi:hypothetical protein
MAPDDLFTRDEVLGGLPARRAASTLFLIESRAAYLADQSRQATNFLVSEDAARRRDLVFLEAFSGGREPPVRSTIQDLERFAPAWAPFVPPQPPLRAAVAHMLGRKYRFTREAVPRLRAALALDDAAVAQAYRRQYREDIDAIYAPRVRTVDRLRLAWSALSARVDALPPFWLTFLLTIAFSFSQAFLALPTGVATMGAIPGVALVVAIGLVNVLTMACIAESCARSGDFRYGKAFLGRLVTGYLGAEASLFFSVITALRTFLVMLAGSIGIALTLAASTGIRSEVWIAAVAAGELYYLSRKSQALTITTMLALVAANLALFVVIMGFALAHLDPVNLLRLPASSTSGGFDAVALKLALGVVVMLYIGHVYIIQCAKIVLPRDPSARSLIQGSVAGTIVLVGIFSTWILAVNGVVPAGRLAREAGTALPSLAERIGPTILVLGSALVILLLGMSCLRTSTVMFNLVQERLPSRLRATLTMNRRRGDLLLESRARAADGVRLGVRYLGLSEGGARLRVDVQKNDEIERTEVLVVKTWDAAELTSHLQDKPLRAGTLVLDVLDAEPATVRLRVTTTMALALGGDWRPAERPPTDITELPTPLRELALLLVRRGEMRVAEATRDVGGDAEAVRAALDTLVADGFAERVDATADPRYRTRGGARRGREAPGDVWAALGQPAHAHAPGGATSSSAMKVSAWRVVLSDVGRFVLSSSPILLVALIGETMLVTGSASFAGVLGFGGVIANSITSGIFPVLLLLASRRKGDRIPGTVYRVIGHPVFLTSVYLLSVANLFLHGLLIYRDVWARGCALLFGVVVIAVTARMIRGGAFGHRTVVELREDARDGATSMLTVIGNGRAVTADVTVSRPQSDETYRAATVSLPPMSKITRVTVKLPRGTSREVKVWAHRVMLDGASEGLPVVVDVRCRGEERRFDLALSSGQAVATVDGEESEIAIRLRDAEEC